MARKISPRQQQVARLLVGGNSQNEAARIVGIDKSTVSRYVREPSFQRELQRLQELADNNASVCVPGIPEKISEGAQKGTEVLLSILADERDDLEMLKLKANVALEYLSRAGYTPVKRVQVNQTSIGAVFTSEDIERIKKRAQELGMKSSPPTLSQTNVIEQKK